MKKYIITISFLLVAALSASADEGMWMVNAISKALVQKMEGKGLKLKAREIYSEDAVSLKDAIVSLDFGCSGSLISPEGLLITNHHCAYSDVHALSTPEHNYLRDGFTARTRAEEKYIPGKSIYFLKKVLDVTDEVEALKIKEKTDGKPMGMRRLSYLMEKKYKAETGLDASLSSMWSGGKYYLALYEVYTDIRLVVAPPESIAAYGGDIDNWEWPQHKGDFSIYRIYAGPDGKPAPHSEANVPMKSARFLTISTKGIKEGDYAMIMGYPGVTDRYASSAKVRYETEVSLPIINKVRSGIMDIIKAEMDANPEIRLKYADRFFSLSNGQELMAGEVLCYKRFGVENEKKMMEKELMAAEHGNLLAELDSKYAAISPMERNTIFYRETMIRGSRLSIVATRMNSQKRGGAGKKTQNIESSIDKEYAALDLGVEKKVFRYCVETYFENVDSSCWGTFQKELKQRFGSDYDALCNEIWVDRKMTPEDGIFKFYTDVSIVDFNKKLDAIQGDRRIVALGHEYAKKLYEKRLSLGQLQYPDANSTMRLTYGTVGGYSPRDGVNCSWITKSTGILEKEKPGDFDFSLKDDWKALLTGAPSPIPVNFLTDNDITGGNSGSAVMNARGELIGLAFDGNKESLASDKSFTPGYNKCVCVDIRYVVWILRNYIKPGNLLDEINIK